MTRVALWARVSSDDQETDNQVLALRAWAARREFEVVREYVLEASAFTGRSRPHLRAALEDARRGAYDVLVVWALDRLSREGILETLGVIRQFHHAGVRVLSTEETWTDGPIEHQELLIALVAWVAQQESRRKSERVKAGLERRRAQGLPVGRQPGARDAKPRKVSGYHRRYGH